MIVNYNTCPMCSSNQINLFLKSKDFSMTQTSFDIYKCKSCDFTFTQNIPDQSSIGVYYTAENYISHSDTKKGFIATLYHWVRNYMLAKKAKIVLNHSQGNTLLDIGSGTGYFLNTMKNKNWEVQGLEPSQDAIISTQKKFNINAKHPDELFSIKEASFNCITMWHVLEHVHKLHDYAEQIKKILKPNGSWIIAVPNHSSFDAQFYKEAWAAYDLPIHLWHFTPNTMKNYAKQHGFEIVAYYRMPFDAFYIALLSEKYRENPFGFVRGFLIGTISWFKALLNLKNCSSIIYILKVKK